MLDRYDTRLIRRDATVKVDAHPESRLADETKSLFYRA
jgi:hypothetical protein